MENSYKSNKPLHMKKTFTKEYMIENRGCYDADRVIDLYFKNGNDSITIEDILNSSIPTKDKCWFVCRKTKLSKDVNQKIAIDLAEMVLPIYEKRYPNNSSVRESIEAAKKFIGAHISLDSLIEKRAAAAYADAAAADAADIKKGIEKYINTIVNNQPED